MNRGTLCLRLAFLGAAIGVYFLFDWRLLCSLLRDAEWALFTVLGQECTRPDLHGRFFLVFSGGHSFLFSPACTYIDVFLILLPFSWRFRQTIWRNLRNIAFLGGFVAAGNLARVFISLYGYHLDYPWQAVHDVPDQIIHLALVSWFAWRALAADSGIHASPGRLLPLPVLPRTAPGAKIV